MANQAEGQRIHTLIIPTAGLSLLVPSATVAEVVNVPPITRVPHTPEWLFGVMAWRGQVVPVVSFEGLQGEAPKSPVQGSKIVVFFPFSGRKEWEFFSVLAVTEPQTHLVDETLMNTQSADIPESICIAAALTIDDRIVVIPDMDALRETFYPAY